MAAPELDLNKPDPSNQYGSDLTAIRDNLVSLAIYAASNGGRLPGWDSVFTWSSGNLTEMVLTHKVHTSVKIRITYSYTGDPAVVNKESYYFDKGLGAGYELVNNGVLTYGYTGSDLTSVTAGNT